MRVSVVWIARAPLPAGSRVVSAATTPALSLSAGRGEDRLSVIAMARGRGRRGGRRGGRGRGRRGGRVPMDRGPPRNEDIDLPEVRVLDDDKVGAFFLEGGEGDTQVERRNLPMQRSKPRRMLSNVLHVLCRVSPGWFQSRLGA